jgi:Uma2 family endonuclease
VASTTRRLTYDDLEVIVQERAGDRHEIINGELVVTPSPVPRHQIVSLNLTRILDQFVVAGKLGTVLYAPIDIRLSPDNVLIPDIVFIAQARGHLIGQKAIEGPPDLVVEIVSPGTKKRDLTVKRNLYARFGVPEYWVVDPIDRTVSVFERSGNAYQSVPHAADGSVQSRVLPSLERTLQMVFEGI